MKVVDVSCPNCGGRLIFNEGDKFGVCESCGSQVTIEQGVDHLLNRAFDLIQQKKIVSAEKILNEGILLDSKNGQLYLGLLMCELGVKSPDELTNVNKDYSNSPNYIRALQFLDSTSKTELQSCCEQNIYNLEHKTEKEPVYPTEKMNEFMALDNITINGDEMSLFTFMSLCFNQTDDKEKLSNVVLKYGSQFEKATMIYKTLSSQEIAHLPFFDVENAEKIIESYGKIKTRIQAVEFDDEDTVDNEDVDDYETDEDVDDYEDDYDNESEISVSNNYNNIINKANFSGANFSGINSNNINFGVINCNRKVVTSHNDEYDSNPQNEQNDFERGGITYYEYMDNDELSSVILELKEKIKKLIKEMDSVKSTYDQQIEEFNLKKEFRKSDKLAKELSKKVSEIDSRLCDYSSLVEKQRQIVNCELEIERINDEYQEYIKETVCTTLSQKLARKRTIKEYEKDLSGKKDQLLKLNKEYSKMERRI